MNVLSLFDGMSCGQQALERAGIKVDKYFASEIDKYAMQVTMANYPNTIQLGSVVNVEGGGCLRLIFLLVVVHVNHLVLLGNVKECLQRMNKRF